MSNSPSEIHVRNGSFTFDLLNKKNLLEIAQNNNISNVNWLKFMQDTFETRRVLYQKYEEFQHNRFVTEICVKVAVSVTLAVALSFGISSTLLLGASLTLGLSNIIYSYMNPINFNYSLDNSPGIEEDDQTIDKVRTKWIQDAIISNYGDEELISYKNMQRAGLALVLGFATFAAISSGAAFLMTLSSVLFSRNLFLRQIDAPKPFIEQQKLSM